MTKLLYPTISFTFCDRTQDFALITDFNTEQNDTLILKGPAVDSNGYNTYHVTGVKNERFISLIKDKNLASELNLDMYSSALIYSQGANVNQADIIEYDIVAIFPSNAKDPLFLSGGGLVINLTPNADDEYIT